MCSAELTATAETVDHLCRRYGFPTRHARLTPTVRGANGRIWRLDTTDTRYAVKELFWEHDVRPEAIPHEVAFRNATVRNGVRSPASIPNVDGSYLTRLGNVLVRLYTWVDGHPITTPSNAASWVGRTLAQMHVLHYPATGPHDHWFDRCPSSQEWRQLARDATTAQAVWAPQLAQALPLVDELSILVTPVATDELITCHLDLHPSNVLLNDNQELVLLDWDNTGNGSAERELASALMAWHVHNGRPNDAAVLATVKAYRAAGGQASITGTHSFGTHLATSLNYIHVWADTIRASSASAEHLDFANRQVTQGLNRLPTPQLLTSLAELAGR
ncbi:phosphotransferase family enzyme [Actinocrispum wychmicini]|uniref:Phosphotransferase family enzyme n=1 Tax=Actinocrispum wychmicini TaxID=1213861 RepID=A0A4R2JM25_9PSEU|nr:phosphotransferase family enzyme [Actinocrispum wychmicini]